MVVIGPNKSEILVIAHRGGRYWKGKNKNFNYVSEALYHGADIIELDIRLKEGEYVVQHSKATVCQGKLEDALKKVGKTPIYLDIKDEKIDPNNLISFTRKRLENKIIIGSFYSSILKKIKKTKNLIISYQIYSPLYDIKTVKKLNADWVVLWNYNIAGWKIHELNKNNINFAPAGNLLPKQQLNYVKKGANAIFVYDVKRFKKIVSKENIYSKNKAKKLTPLRFFYSKIKKIEPFIPIDKTIIDVKPDFRLKNFPTFMYNLTVFKINFKLK